MRELEKKRQEEYRKTLQNAPMRAPGAYKEKAIEDFHADPRYGGDLTRSDLAYATYAISRGHSPQHVEAALAQRDLSHKGATKRQQDYIGRTIKKAQEHTISRGMSR